MTLEQLTDAELEVVDAVAYYESRKAGLGLEFLAEVERAYQVILAAPQRWPRLTPRTRRYRLNRFPYGVVYECQPTKVLVVAVMHLARRPGYWMRRFP